MKKILPTLTACLTLFFTSCREEDLDKQAAPTATIEKASKVSLGEYQSDMPYNVNIVYFIPSDVTARPEYERRVSEFMLVAQDYYRQNMYNWGYGNRGFGLLKNPTTNRIKINVINGALPVSSYPYGSGSKILTEVNNWFTNHPADKTSDHTIIFTAVPTPETEIPYYGLGGRICFVGDNEAWDYQNFNQNSDAGTKAKWYMGGFLHELGHALNLPHNALQKTLTTQPNYGTSLMSFGNGTYGYSSTILTKADCAILNNNQVFSTTAKPAGYFYSPGKSFTVTSISSSYSNGRINISGTYSANAPLNAILSHFVPESNYYYTVSGLSNYSSNTFNTYIDVEDLHLTNNESYLFALQAQFEDGNKVDAQYYYFTFKDGIPNFQFSIDQTNWTATTSSQYTPYPASFAIDGNINTYWHSNYTPGSVQADPIAGHPQNFPYYFDINIGSIKEISGLYFIQHQQLVRTAKNLNVWTRATTNDAWKYQGNYNLTNTTAKQYIDFPQKESSRYIRISFESSFDGLPYVAMPEIGAYENKLF